MCYIPAYTLLHAHTILNGERMDNSGLYCFKIYSSISPVNFFSDHSRHNIQHINSIRISRILHCTNRRSTSYHQILSQSINHIILNFTLGDELIVMNVSGCCFDLIHLICVSSFFGDNSQCTQEKLLPTVPDAHITQSDKITSTCPSSPNHIDCYVTLQ